MPYIKIVTDLGNMKFICKTQSVTMLGNHNMRLKRCRPSSESVEKHNKQKAAFELECKLIMNFDEGDYNLALTYNRSNRPCQGDALKRIQAYNRAVHRWCKNNGIVYKYVYATHITKSGVIHHHIIINKDVPLAVLQGLWTFGQVRVGHCLYPRKDFGGLAKYFMCLDDKHISSGEGLAEGKGLRKYNCSKGLKKPTKEYIECKYEKWREIPRKQDIPSEWQIRIGSLYNGIDMYGRPYQKYIIERIADDMKKVLSNEEIKKAYDLEKMGKYRWQVAQIMHCSESTLARGYQSLGLKNPKRGKYNKRKNGETK